MSRALQKLLDRLFASLLDETPWLAFLEELERCLPCHHCTMVLRKPREGDPGVLVSAPANQPAMAALQQRHFRDSPFLELPEGQVCVLTEAELRGGHPGYYRYIREYSRVTDLVGIDLREPATGMTFRLRGARVDGEPPFGERERRFLAELLPRLRTAVALYARLAQQQLQLNVLDQTAARLAVGSMVLDADGRLLLKNLVADRLLAERDGLLLRSGVLHCVDAADERRFRGLLARLRGGELTEDTPFRVRRAGHGHWSVLLRPGRAGPGLEEGATRTAVLLLRQAGTGPRVTEAALGELFGLTRAEAALTVRLVQGESLDEAARALGISRYTARSQLASVFARTGVHRQPQLVSLVLAALEGSWG